MKRLLLSAVVFALFACATFSSFAQTVNLGAPLSWSNKLTKQAALMTEVMPPFNLPAIKSADSINYVTGNGPWMFGYEHPVNYSLANSGLWETTPKGDRIWRLHVNSPNAVSINVVFNDFFLPPGATLHAYDYDRTKLVGAYTDANNNVNNMLGTEVVPGSSMIIEYFEPQNVMGQGRLMIGTVVHGYRNINEYFGMPKVNESGNCNMDVICPDGDPWRDEIRSVARILNGGGLCTGTLVNNTANDGTPYFLTANHCGPQSMGGAVFKFNYDSPVCQNPAQDPGTNDVVNGSVLRARRAESDFGLIELNTVPPAAYNVYYAGWDKTGAIKNSVVGIHHPAGDVKKLAFDDDPITVTSYGGTAVPGDNSHWRIETWERSTTTEGGSSGSAIFDPFGRVIGQLHGGGAACGNTQSDWYGRFSVSWDGANSSQRLRDWLDPSNNNDTWDGYDPNAPSTPDNAGIQNIVDPSDGTTLCNATTFTPIVTLRNYGSNNLTSVTINYDLDGGPNQTYSWTGNLTPASNVDVTLPAMSVTAGAHVFNASTTMPNGTADTDNSNDANLSNFTVLQNATVATLTLDVDCWGSEVTWEVQDAGATTLYSGGPYSDAQPDGDGPFTADFCLADGCYDFIINDSYGDGMFGSQYGTCNVDGNYVIDDDQANNLVTMPTADYGTQATHNFCVTFSGGCNITATTTSTDVTCNGVCDGTATVTPTGGTSPYTYSWDDPGTQTTQTAVGLCAGTYTVTITDAAACTQTATVTITEPTAVTVVATANDATCFGVCDGLGVATATGGTLPYTYAWSSGGTQPTESGLCAGTYTVTVTDANGCTGITTVVVNEPPALFAAASATDASCAGTCDGTVVATATGGTLPYTYSWDGGLGGGSTHTNVCAGTYNVTITDANGCIANATVTVNAPTSVVATATFIDESCAGSCDGSATAIATGGTPPYTYSWDDPGAQTTPTATGLCAGVYIVTVTDANGCVGIYTVVINSGSNITVSATSTDATCGQCDGTATGSVTGGASPFIFSWSSGGNTPNETGLCAGTYTLTVTDANGCSGSTSVTINDLGGPVATISTTTDASCNGVCDGSATVVATGGTPPYTYLWSTGGTSATETGLCAGVHTVTVTDANGCTTVATATITEPTAMAGAISTTAASCGLDNGSACVTVAGGTPPYTYQWDDPNNQTTQCTGIGVPAGLITVVVTDANGCTATFSEVVNAVSGPTVAINTYSDVTCNGGCDGFAVADVTGGTSPYSYSWSSGGNGPTEGNLCAGTYTVTVTDIGGCVATATVTISEPSALTVNAIATDESCAGTCDGSATAVVTGGTPPYAYTWSNGCTGLTCANLCAGTYTLNVTDANGCTGTAVVTVNASPGIVVTATTTDESCAGSCDGTATAIASGGTAPYTYLWDDPNAQTTQTATGLCAGVYIVYVTDANGCTNLYTVVINSGGTLNVLTTANDATCGQCDGLAVATASGGASPYTYQWDDPNNQTGPTAGNLCAGTYTVTVTDANGCTGTSTVVVNSIGGPTVTATVTPASCFGACDGTATVVASGGTAPYTYLWDDPNTQTTSTATGLCAGVYTATVTDANGCASSVLVTVWEPAVLAVTGTVTDESFVGAGDGAINITVTGGTTPYTYLWNPNNETTEDLSGLSAGTYYVTVTDANGCTAIVTFVVGVSTGIADQGSNIQYEVFPNPNSGQFTIAFAQLNGEDLMVKIMDVQGKVVLEEKVTNNQGDYRMNVNIASEARGIYYLQVITDQSVNTQKIIKQ